AAEGQALESSLERALELLWGCFRQVRNSYYHAGGQVRFNPLHAGQYCLFLHFATRAVREAAGEATNLCDKLYYLNRIMHCVDLFYEAGLPDIFFVDHPLGSCMGRATYSDYLLFFQGCTVGGRKHEHPVLGKRIVMFAGAKILGRSRIGDNTVLSANACVSNQDVPGDCMVFGSSPALVFKPLPTDFLAEYFAPAPTTAAP
ncbi:MAG: hypothetical protein Q8S17_00460, partial [Humidesulfovibrio sp.]|nr:hypothetical protein [Humidesulfovibrio sp.]